MSDTINRLKQFLDCYVNECAEGDRLLDSQRRLIINSWLAGAAAVMMSMSDRAVEEETGIFDSVRSDLCSMARKRGL